MKKSSSIYGNLRLTIILPFALPTWNRILSMKLRERMRLKKFIKIQYHGDHRSRRLADATGRCHKFAVDGLVRSGILPDDSPAYLQEIRETFKQRKNDETVIEVSGAEINNYH